MDRTAIATTANALASQSRRGGAPKLAANSSRVDVLSWLQWNDGNGCYLDHLAISEGFDPMTDDEAWSTLVDVIADL